MTGNGRNVAGLEEQPAATTDPEPQSPNPKARAPARQARNPDSAADKIARELERCKALLLASGEYSAVSAAAIDTTVARTVAASPSYYTSRKNSPTSEEELDPAAGTDRRANRENPMLIEQLVLARINSRSDIPPPLPPTPWN